ncbi:MAG TPA: hypothetical protein VEB64_15865 [Azospirillaceae bacterium]|nr:hypothetical protein [Azospirillaceae bacterium]
MLSELKRSLRGANEPNPGYEFLLDEDSTEEMVSIHCEATTYNVASAQLRALAAIPIRGNRILMSRRLEVRHGAGEDWDGDIDRFLRLVGSRPLVGYYLTFTTAVLDKHIRRVAGISLPNPQVEVSGLYYDRKIKTSTKSTVDLRLDSVLRDLDLPPRRISTPFNDALASALIYLKIQVPVRF